MKICNKCESTKVKYEIKVVNIVGLGTTNYVVGDLCEKCYQLLRKFVAIPDEASHDS